MTIPPSTQIQRPPIAQLAWAMVVTVIAVVLLWMVEGMPTICPAIYPAPPSCAPDARTGPAIWGTVTMVGLFAVTIVAAFLLPAPRRKGILEWMCMLLGAVALAVIGLTLFSSGFAIGF